jgi:uncharacterized membrane protein
VAFKTVEPARDSVNLGPPLPQETPKPPFRPQVAGRIGFFFSIVAGALVSIVSLRRMGHSEKAKKVLWITVLSAAVIAVILPFVPDALGRPVGLGLEVAWYFVFPKIQDQEFQEWQATHADIDPTSGGKRSVGASSDLFCF